MGKKTLMNNNGKCLSFFLLRYIKDNVLFHNYKETIDNYTKYDI
jgi:hypothetical protein